MTRPLTSDLLSTTSPERLALFLDFDGTLVELAETPEDVRLEPAVRRDLGQLADLTGNAVAMVSGRTLEEIDAHLALFTLPTAAVHGSIRRDAAGRMHRQPVDENALKAIERRLTAFADDRAGLIVEPKAASLALHFRQRPELEPDCLAQMEAATADFPGVALLHGKMVIEAKLGRSDKGQAITDFMAEPPFAGRVALFAGDDRTDEDGFAAVNRMGGISIKVGDGETAACYRAASIEAFHGWLRDLTRSLAQWQERRPN